MTNENKEIMKQYPIFKIKIPEICELKPGSCGVSDIKMDMVGIKELKESYIVKYHCSANRLMINALAGADITPACEEVKFPLDAFVITKSGMEGDPNSYEDEEMPATDYCSLKDERTNEYAVKNCGNLVHGFPYTDEMNGYKLIPLTDENRAEVYAEFKEKGFFYEESQTAMNKLIEEQSLLFKVENGIAKSLDFLITNTKITDEKITAITDAEITGAKLDPFMCLNAEETQTWSEYASSVIDAGVNMVGAMVDCVMDLPHCLDVQ